MSAHAMMFLIAFIAGGFALVHHLSSGKTLTQDVYEMGVVKAGVFASVFGESPAFWSASSLRRNSPFRTFFILKISAGRISGGSARCIPRP